MQDIMNPVIAVDQADMIADQDVAVSRRWRSKLSIEPAWHGPNGGAHVGRENETLANFGLPIPMPISVVAIPKVPAMVLIPIARLLAIVVVKAVVVMTIAVVIAIVVIAIVMVPVVISLIVIMMVPVVISLIVIMMVAIIMILSISERYA